MRGSQIKRIEHFVELRLSLKEKRSVRPVKLCPVKRGEAVALLQNSDI